MDNEKTSDSVRAVDRALEILLAFRPGDDELTVAELLKRVDLSRPTLYRLLNTLEHNEFLVSSGEPQRFRLGPSVARLSHVWSANLDISALAQPTMRRLREATGETVALFIPDGLYRLCVAELESPQPLSFKRGVGYREKLIVGASGRSILAFMDCSEQDLQSYASGQPIDTQKCLQEFARIRERRFAISRNELIQGAVSIAAPFFKGPDRVGGSLCLFGPSVRLADERVEQFSQILIREADQLSGMLGCRR